MKRITIIMFAAFVASGVVTGCKSKKDMQEEQVSL